MNNDDPTDQLAASRLGRVLRGKWRLDRVLGVGGMAAVYAATHRNGTRVAIKMLHPEVALHEQLKARFLREGYVANSVEHPGTVRVVDDDVAEDGSVYLVMDLLEGETLEGRRVRCGGILPVEEVLSLADRLLDVLAAAHKKGVIHRDIKPENVFLTNDGTLKVLDFGIARLQQATSGASATQTGMSMGTPAFMSPEQAKGRWDEVDARTDIWAVGASMMTLLTGRETHEAATSTEQLILAATARPPSLRQIMPAAPPVLVEIVDRALAFDRFGRWGSALEMQHAIRGLQSGAYAGTLASAPAPAVAGTTRQFASQAPQPAGYTAPGGAPYHSGSLVPPPPVAHGTARASGRSTGTIVGIIAAVVALGGIGTGAFLVLRSKDDGAEARDKKKARDKNKDKDKDDKEAAQPPSATAPPSIAAPAPSPSATTPPSVAAPASSPSVDPNATCTATLAVSGANKKASCTVDARVAGHSGTLTYPCAGGPAEAKFGTMTFKGEVKDGKVNVVGHTSFTFSDKCKWLTAQVIKGDLASGTLSFTYNESPAPGQHNCAEGCSASAGVKVTK